MTATIARIDSIVKYICEKSNWSISNLKIQKILYIAQMIYMGRHKGEKLFAGNFEAWKFGPVEPNLYQKIKVFGSGSVQDIFYDANELSDEVQIKFLDEICDDLLNLSSAELVSITHWKGGAWAKHYEMGARSITIPDSDIEKEYHDRFSKQS